jgi:hypothetical protein
MPTTEGEPGETDGRQAAGSSPEFAAGITWESRLPAAPVDYVGTIDGAAYSFRARGGRWMLTIAETPERAVEAQLARDPLDRAYFAAEGRYHRADEGLHTGFAASWMPLEQAEAIIRCAAAAWRAARDVRPRR